MTNSPVLETKPRQFGVRVGPMVLRGWWALLFLAAMLGLITYEIVRDKPWVDPSPLWITAVLWLSMETYWSVKARSAAPAVSSESAKSRAVHTRLFMAAIALFFVDVRGLNGHWIPPARWVAPSGVAIQAAGLWFAIWARKTLGRHWSGELTVWALVPGIL